MKPAWTDAPIYELGDSTKPQGGVFPTFPVRKCRLLSYRGDKYVKVEVEGVVSWVKAYCLYSKKGRYGDVRPVSWRRLRKLYAITKRNNLQPIAIIVDPDTARKIDALRGDMSRAEYLRRLVDVPQLFCATLK